MVPCGCCQPDPFRGLHGIVLAFTVLRDAGAYTTARTVNVTNVLELSFHIERMADTARLMRSSSNDVGVEPTVLLSAGTLTPVLLATLRAAVIAFQEASQQKNQEMRLTMLSHWESGVPVVAAHVGPMPSRAKPPVKIQIAGRPRSNAAAKDSEWVRQRASLEALKPADVGEVILVSEGTS